MEDPHQFFMLRQGCDDLIPWKNPDCGSKQNVYKMVKKRKWTELDAEKERREEEGYKGGVGRGFTPHKQTSVIEKRLQKILPMVEEPTLKGIEMDEKDKPKESIMQIIQDQIMQDNRQKIFNTSIRAKSYYGFPRYN